MFTQHTYHFKPFKFANALYHRTPNNNQSLNVSWKWKVNSLAAIDGENRFLIIVNTSFIYQATECSAEQSTLLTSNFCICIYSRRQFAN